MIRHHRPRVVPGARPSEEIVHDGPETKCGQLARIIAARIEHGAVDRRLPAMHVLAAEFGVSEGTVRRALAILRERRLIVTSPGRGTFAVRDRAARDRAAGSP